jgi:hypothetical protein
MYISVISNQQNIISCNVAKLCKKSKNKKNRYKGTNQGYIHIKSKIFKKQDHVTVQYATIPW